jgi:hypothetical protein
MTDTKLLKENLELYTECKIKRSKLVEIEDLMYEENDFTIELDNKEFRFISENTIEATYYDSQKELIEEVYFPKENLPWWIEIDWEQTIENVLSADGYGNHFSTYDGSEESFAHDGELWYIFRTN